jgi:hypothetical protein
LFGLLKQHCFNSFRFHIITPTRTTTANIGNTATHAMDDDDVGFSANDDGVGIYGGGDGVDNKPCEPAQNLLQIKIDSYLLFVRNDVEMT